MIYDSLLSCQIVNMADAAIARREARRRKILENSHNRLQFISGKNDNESCKESFVSTKPVDSTENSVPNQSSILNKCFLNNGMANTLDEPFSFVSTNQESFATGEGDVTISSHDLTAFLSPSNTTPTAELPQPSTPLFEKITVYKYDIALLSILIQILYWFSLVTLEKTYFFLPLVLYVVTKNFWLPKQNNSNFANVLLLLNGMSPSRVQKIISITQHLSTFSQDVCVFLFTTICIQSLYQSLRDCLD